MKINKEITTFQELWEQSWSGAKDTLKEIIENDKEEELMNYLEELFYNETPTETEVNDFLWFDRDRILEDLEIEENEE